MKRRSDASDGCRDGRSDAGSGMGLLAQLREIESVLAGLSDELRPERVDPRRVSTVVNSLSAIERRARGARLLLRKAEADSGAWRKSGARSPADHMARQEGISVGQAKAELAASERLASQPKLRDAVAAGDLSVEKAKAVAEAAAADPSAEACLVATARSGDLAATRDAARGVITRADERGGRRREAIYRRRSLRAWLSVDGEGHGHWNVPADMHARFLAALEPYRRQAVRDARANGQPLNDETLMADALDLLARDTILDHSPESPEPSPTGAEPATAPGPARTPQSADAGPHTPAGSDAPAEPHSEAESNPLAEPHAPAESDALAGANAPATAHAPVSTGGPGRPGKPRPPDRPRAGRRGRRRAPAQVHVLVDFDALMRGHAREGETAEIPGLGPVPVSLVQQMMGDSLLRLILTGSDVTVITSQQRYVPAKVRAALVARDRGRCVVPGCGATRGLEVDHCHTDFARGGPTALHNLALLCRNHHTLKSTCGWTLTGDHETGWGFTPPKPREKEPP